MTPTPPFFSPSHDGRRPAPGHALDRLTGPISRRTLLAGVGAAAALAACGGSDDDATGDGGDGAPGGSDGDQAPDDAAEEYAGDSADLEPGTFTLVQRFPSTALVPGEVRLPHSLVRDAEFINDGPTTLGARVVDLDLNPIGERMIAERLDITPSSYYVWRPTVETPGVYFLIIDGGPEDGAAFQVMEPGQVTVPGVGDPLPGFDTPTAAAPGGVDPICTREPVCPFHEVTLDEALDDGRGVVYLVGTPAFCQTGTCAPALEATIGVAPEYADDFVFVHSEVYTDLTATELSPAIGALGMAYEPALFVTDGSGTIVDRLDAIWGAEELRQRLDLARA